MIGYCIELFFLRKVNTEIGPKMKKINIFITLIEYIFVIEIGDFFTKI